MVCIEFVLFLIQCLCFIEHSHGHGYLADPPARSSAWLFDKDFAACCQYYSHAEMFCGGAHHQWNVNGKDIFCC
jgi:predicted carbohydrate-binding protein with CBM5 and CBM33 domain